MTERGKRRALVIIVTVAVLGVLWMSGLHGRLFLNFGRANIIQVHIPPFRLVMPKLKGLVETEPDCLSGEKIEWAKLITKLESEGIEVPSGEGAAAAMILLTADITPRCD